MNIKSKYVKRSIKNAKVKPIFYMCLGMLLVALPTFLVIPKIIQAMTVVDHSMSFMTDINEYVYIINDYKSEIVTSEYTNTLLQRKIDRLTSENDYLLEKFTNTKKVQIYHEAVSHMIQSFDEMRIKIENQEPLVEDFFLDNQFKLATDEYTEAMENIIKLW